MAAEKYFGIETEYGAHVRRRTDDGFVALTPLWSQDFDELRDVIRAVVDRATGIARGLRADDPHEYTAYSNWLPNGGQIYIDMQVVPEYASPETSDPFELVRQHRLGDTIMGLAAEEFNATQDDYECRIIKGNVDANDETFGTHENYQVRGRLDIDRIVPVLGSFLASRVVVVGSGGIGRDGSRYWGFTRSPRARFITQMTSDTTTRLRPLIYNERKYDTTTSRYQRLHLINGDANQFDVPNLLKIGTTAVVLAMLEDGARMGDLAFVRPLDALSDAAWGPLDRRVELMSGRTMTLLEHQQAFAERAARYVAKHGDRLFARPGIAGEIVDRWRTVLEDLAIDPQRTVGVLEWTTRYAVLNGRRERDGLDWDAAELRQIDLRWGELGTASPVAVLERKQLVTRFNLDSGLNAITPPRDSRAALRGLVAERFQDQVSHMSWGGFGLRDPETDRIVPVSTQDAGAYGAPFVEKHRLRELAPDEIVVALCCAELRSSHRGTTLSNMDSVRTILGVARNAPAEERTFIAHAVATAMVGRIQSSFFHQPWGDRTEFVQRYVEAVGIAMEPLPTEQTIETMTARIAGKIAAANWAEDIVAEHEDALARLLVTIRNVNEHARRPTEPGAERGGL